MISTKVSPFTSPRLIPKVMLKESVTTLGVKT